MPNALKLILLLQHVPIEQINTFCPIVTHIRVAIIYVKLAVDACVAWFTSALIGIDQVLALAAIFAGIRYAFIIH